ncbi:MAG: hypothetical protein HN368_12890 [Spirochaetales bacterium]|nr:hypothetical protein [Spirochaetales bacterium]
MQTPREVIRSLFQSTPADRAGLRDSPWSDALVKWVGQGYPADSDGKPALPDNHFGFDMIGVGGFEWTAKLVDDVVVDETDNWDIRMDGNGASFKRWKHKSGTPEHVNFAMASRKIWEDEYKPHIVGSVGKRATDEALSKISTSLKRIRDDGKWADFGFRGLWENMRAAFGDINLYENMLLDPDWITDYCRTYTDLYHEEFRLTLEKAGKPDGVWFFDDLGYKGATFCNPELYKQLIFPFYHELISMIHSHGVKVVLHSCGYTEPVLDLVVDAGFDGIHPLEVKAGNQILQIAEKYGEKLVFVGGLDARIIESHDHEYMRKEISALMKGLKERGARFVFGSDHSLSTVIDYEDFQYVLEVYREHMLY